jgi:putative tryptophan/tyrosine transport system substrate-binding protein
MLGGPTNRRAFIAGLGGVATWPLTVFAQQSSRIPRIGWLGTPRLDSPDATLNREAFLQAMRDLGYVQGQNLLIEYRVAEGDIERLPELAAELVHLNVDLIVAAATPAARAAQRATTAIPIVVNAMGDPVQDGLVSSLARPGGNITGTTFLGPELVPKRIALLRELLPRVVRVAGLWQPGAHSKSTMADMLMEAKAAADQLGLHLQLITVQSPDDLDRAFITMAGEGNEALFQFPSTLLFSERRRVVELAQKHHLPEMYDAREFVQLGGLAAYGANINDLFRSTAAYADRILKGAKPSELPVLQPTKFEFVINLKTAKSLDLTLSPSLLARADEVIE